MRVAIVCNDTRGGMQPYAALGTGLQRAGHEVRVVAPAEFAGMFAAAGLAFMPLSGPSGKAHVATVLPLANIKEAFELSEGGRTRGKIVLRIAA